MEEKKLRIMIEKFFNAELSVEEERGLCAYLREYNVPAALQKDKEAIMLLCGSEETAELPAGAEARLEAMIDSLATDEVLPEVDEDSVGGSRGRRLVIPRFIWRSAVAAVLVVAGYMFMDENLPSQELHPAVAEFSDEDTFDNPEDAMKCFMIAVGDMQQAMAVTFSNAKEMRETLKSTLSVNNKMITK